ncbi:MAG: hypothetical protein WBM40_14485 [Thiohalocapsa sp.]
MAALVDASPTSDFRLFLDANILSSAAHRDGSPPVLLFDLEDK